MHKQVACGSTHPRRYHHLDFPKDLLMFEKSVDGKDARALETPPLSIHNQQSTKPIPSTLHPRILYTLGSCAFLYCELLSVRRCFVVLKDGFFKIHQKPALIKHYRE